MNSTITSEQISNSASYLKQIRPAYEPLIDFHKEMFIAQEESKAYLDLDPIVIDHNKLKLKINNGMPLTDSSKFVIDPGQAETLLLKLCNMALEKAPHLSRSAEQIIMAFSKKKFKVENIFNALLKNDYNVLENILKPVDINADALIFFAFEAMIPSIQTCSAQLSHYLRPESKVISSPEELLWKKGYCPVCGNIPQMGFFNQDGEKHLVCSFCLQRWKTSRMGCSLCQNSEKDKQHYFFNEEEKEYRVDLCDNCGKYIKFVDLRELTRAFYPPLEMLCTLHLDMQAIEQGYVGVVQNKVSEHE